MNDQQNSFLKAVKNGDIGKVKTYLTEKESNRSNHEHNSEQMEVQSPEDAPAEEPSWKKFKREIEGQFTLTASIWLEAVTIAKHKCYDDILELLLTQNGSSLGYIKGGHPFLNQVVTEYLADEYDSRKLKALEILLALGKTNENVFRWLNKTITEIICKIKPKNCVQIDDLLQILFRNGIDIIGRKRNRETFLMLACKNRRIDIVDGLIKLFVHYIDALDNSGETTLLNADGKGFHERLKLISAVKDKNADIVKSMLFEFRNTAAIVEKSWNWNEDDEDIMEELETKSDIWLEAMYVPMVNYTKHSDEILKLLFECDMHLSQEIETGYSSFKQLMYGWQVDDDKNLFEVLLKSGKINVNSTDDEGRTALHWANEKLISLLIDYGADVNKKDHKGMTPLMLMWDKSVSVMRTLLEKAGPMVNLDAIDCDGRTALMHAVMGYRSHAVELLLNAGASINQSDHLGFTALHIALQGNMNKYFEFPRHSEELKIIKKMANFFVAEKHEQSFWRTENWLENRKNVVEMLLQRRDIDLIAFSFEKFSPLDIVEKSISVITPPSIIDLLKEKCAALNFFTQTKSQSTRDFHLGFTRELVMSKLNSHLIVHTEKELDILKEISRTLIETFKQQIVSFKDQQGRTALHFTVISSLFFINGINDFTINDLANTIVNTLISIGCSVNETDNFGRTPLHYANRKLWKLLISKGADASIKDKDGKSATDETSRRSSDKVSRIVRKIQYARETYFLRLKNTKQMEIHVQRLDSRNTSFKTAPGLLWKKGKYAYRHPLATQLTKEVTEMMRAIVKEIERLDPRFKIKPEFVGSRNEGTKLDNPDEFDFCFVLTKISGLCEVSQSPELPTGFVHIKRKPTKGDETSDFDSFFEKDGILNTEKLKWQFATILSSAMVNINSQQSFEWILKLSIGEGCISEHIKKRANIRMTNPLNFFAVNWISVDIVPCIHIDGWWPDEAISNVSNEIKNFGCNLIFDNPQELYPWVPYSDSCARISFSKAESDMISHSCENAKQAYMIGKTINEKCEQEFTEPSKYVLKTCLLYCIEALSPSSEKASQLGLSLEELESKFHQIDRYLWLKCLMKCHLEFVAQDFCPCYFLPTSSNFSLIDVQLEYHFKKISTDWIADRPSKFPLACKYACAFYRWASNDIFESPYQLPAPDPLWERFDRKELIASLCEIAYK